VNLKSTPAIWFSAEAFVKTVLAAHVAGDRLAASYPPPPVNPRPHPDPAKRRRSPLQDYGLVEGELAEWRRLKRSKGYSALEAANVIIRSRRNGDAA
jgi:hypothetical protein